MSSRKDLFATENAQLNKEEEQNNGAVIELTEQEKVRNKLAYWVLGVCVALMLVAWWITIQYPYDFEFNEVCVPKEGGDCAAALSQLIENRKEVSDKLFNFAISWIPPIITLVLGYYFGRNDGEVSTKKVG